VAKTTTTSKKKTSAPKKKGEEAKKPAKDQPGQVSSRLERQMGDALTEIFTKAGTKLYADAIIKLKENLEAVFTEAIEGLKGTVKEELGSRGLKKAATLFKPWVQEIVEEVIQFGLKEVGGTLEDLASSSAAEFTKSKEEDTTEEDLFGDDAEAPEELAPPEDIEEVGEEPVAPEAEEELPEEEGLAPTAPAPVGPAATPAPASTTFDPFKPRVWVSKKPVSTKTANAHLVLTIEQVVKAAGGLETLQKTAKTAPAAYKQLMQAQNQLVAKMASQYAFIEGVSPLTALDWANQYWAHPTTTK